MTAFDPLSDYPIGARRPDLVQTPGGLGIDDLTLERVRTGGVPDEEFRATPETLRLQARVARAAGRDQLADNLERAGELAYVPDHVILDLYTALRPRRSSAEDLAGWADRLERDYEAPAVAALVREAAAAYVTRGLLA
jgi:propanediol dehydratase small subunit